MLEVSQIRECKQLAGQGVAIREISRRLGIARNTIRRYLRGAEPGVYQLKDPRPQPAREQVRERIRDLLKEERKKKTPRKQRLTGSRIHRIVTKQGLQVSERTVRTVVREVVLELRDPLEHAYLPLAYEPGKDAQVDFMEGEVDDVHEGRVRRHVLIVRACYSTRAFRYAPPNQTREALFEGLMRSFEFFGGVFEHMWFDNLSPAVKKVLKGRDRDLQRAFEAFQAHYGFKAEFCRPGKGNEKGGVENEVKRTRQEVFAPIPRVDGRVGLQEHLDALAVQDLDHVRRGRDHTVREFWQHESEKLLPLPPTRFDPATTRIASVTKCSWVQTGTNFYSVPVHLVGCQVTLKLHAEEVVVRDATGEVARHPRSYGRGCMVLDLEHYLPLLERKHRGLDRAVPVRQWLEKVPSCWRLLLEELRKRSGEVDGSKEFVDVLQLCARHGVDKVTPAVQQAVESPSTSLAVVRYYLGLDGEQRRDPVGPIDYDGPTVQQGSAAAYMEVVHG